MTRLIALVLIALLVSAPNRRLAAQQPAKMEGTWDVLIKHDSGRVVDEQWTIKGGESFAGRARTARLDLPLEGTIKANNAEVKVTVNDTRYNIFLGTVDGDSIKGTITVQSSVSNVRDNGTFSAKRATAANH